MSFSIGEFSRMTGLSVKALRLYHEKDLLVPGTIDDFSSYRYYDRNNLDRARIIVYLRQMNFSLNEIKAIIDQYDDESEIIEALEKQKRRIESTIQQSQFIIRSLDEIIQKERKAQMMLDKPDFEIEEKYLEDLLISGIRFKGKYNEIGPYFGKLARKLKGNVKGPAMALYYDGEYKEEDADIEACFPVNKKKDYAKADTRELKGGKSIILIHKGPYQELSRSYSRLFEYLKDKKLTMRLPIREIYWKGPGMIFKGNADNYLTEIQITVD